MRTRETLKKPLLTVKFYSDKILVNVVSKVYVLTWIIFLS